MSSTTLPLKKVRNRTIDVYGDLVGHHPIEMKALSEFSAKILKANNTGEVLSQAVNHLRILLEAKTISVFLFNPVEKVLKVKESVGLGQKTKEKLKIPLGKTLVGEAAVSGKPIYITDPVKGSLKEGMEKGVGSVITLPLLLSPEIPGAILVRTKERIDLGDKVRKVLDEFGRQINLALNKAAVLEENKKQAARQLLLTEFSRVILNKKTEKGVFDATLKYARKILDVDTAGLFFPDKEKRYLVLRSVLSSRIKRLSDLAKLEKVTAPVLKIKINHGFSAARVYRTAKPVVVETTLKETKSRFYKVLVRLLQIKSHIVVPLKLKQTAVGVLTLVDTEKFRRWSGEEIKLAMSIGAIAATTLDNLRLTEQIEKDRARFQTIQNTMHYGLILFDQNDRLIYMNPEIKRLFGVIKSPLGFTRKEILDNLKGFFRYEIEYLFDVRRVSKKVYAQGRSSVGNLIRVHSQPLKILDAAYMPLKDPGGKVTGMLVTFKDITALKLQAEKISEQFSEMRAQTERWQAIFENVEEGVFIMAKDLKIIGANNACELMLGVSEKEMVGRPYYSVFGCHDRAGHYYPDFAPLTKVLATKEPIPYDEHIHVGENNKEIWVGVSYTPIFNEKGEIEQIVSVIRDITSLKELEKAKTEFVSLASHELRTPLTVINGYLSLLLSGDLGGLQDPRFADNLGFVLYKVFNETKRLTKLVEELLNVSRIEEGRLRLNFRKVSVVEAINEVIGEFNALAVKKGVSLQFHERPDQGNTFYVLADKDKIKQVLVNLLDNALKFTNPGGKVAASYQVKNGKAYVSIKDTGIGVAPGLQPRIFEKFQQVQGSYLKENKGTGLGLFIVKSLIELHHGKIWVESKPGLGTKFIFTLPIVAGD